MKNLITAAAQSVILLGGVMGLAPRPSQAASVDFDGCSGINTAAMCEEERPGPSCTLTGSYAVCSTLGGNTNIELYCNWNC